MENQDVIPAGEVIVNQENPELTLALATRDYSDSPVVEEENKPVIGITGLPIADPKEVLHKVPHNSIVRSKFDKVMPGNSKIGITRKNKSESKKVKRAKKNMRKYNK